jgi:flagellar protein FlaJ
VKRLRITMPRMTRIPKKRRRDAAVVSLICAVGFILVPVLVWPSEASPFSNELFLAALLVATVPSATLDHINQKWMDTIETQMPLLVRGVSEIQETGLTFVKAFDKVVENKMVRPPLSDEVKTLSVQMSWGLSFEEALKRFRERISSPIVSRFCALILEASRSGGQIRTVFTATSGFMEEMQDMDRETSSQMRPYLIIIYTAFFTYIFTSIILLSSFFVPLEGYTNVLSPVSMVGAREFRDFFYRTMLISGLVGGLMAGKMGERRVVGGLKHSIAMMVVGYIIFYFTIPPNWRLT